MLNGFISISDEIFHDELADGEGDGSSYTLDVSQDSVVLLYKNDGERGISIDTRVDHDFKWCERRRVK